MKKPRNRKYEVGYRRPPEHAKFKPGQSGNPKGRPKGTKNVATLVRETLYQPLAQTENGRTRNIPLIKGALLKLAQLALRGDGRAIRDLLALAERYQEDPVNNKRGFDELSKEDAEILAAYARRYRDKE